MGRFEWKVFFSQYIVYISLSTLKPDIELMNKKNISTNVFNF